MLNNLVYNRTATDVANGTAKGYYRYTDMNRVQDAVAFIRGRYENAGYSIPEYTIRVWAEWYIPKAEDARKYVAAVRSFENVIVLPEIIPLPATLDNFDYIKANNIERFLFLTDAMMDNIEASWWNCDEIICGEVDL